MDERLTALETKIAYLEDMVVTLNALVIAHGRELELLHANKERLEERLAELAEIAGDIPNRPPPHY
ncbi:MAG: SlyX family protein [Sphaerochaetaceae bacterium]|nr:SlyX family protein [Sphaerochaeta sp.]